MRKLRSVAGPGSGPAEPIPMQCVCPLLLSAAKRQSKDASCPCNSPSDVTGPPMITESKLKAAARPPQFSAEEWKARVDLAACYRIFAHLGWVELIYNHITLRLPGP